MKIQKAIKFLSHREEKEVFLRVYLTKGKRCMHFKTDSSGGTRASSVPQNNYQRAGVYKQSVRPRGYLIQPRQLKKHLISLFLFYLDIFLANAQRATTSLPFSCVQQSGFCRQPRLILLVPRGSRKISLPSRKQLSRLIWVLQQVKCLRGKGQ